MVGPPGLRRRITIFMSIDVEEAVDVVIVHQMPDITA
jgi:hypothetical protein